MFPIKASAREQWDAWFTLAGQIEIVPIDIFLDLSYNLRRKYTRCLSLNEKNLQSLTANTIYGFTIFIGKWDIWLSQCTCYPIQYTMYIIFERKKNIIPYLTEFIINYLKSINLTSLWYFSHKSLPQKEW